MKIERIYPDRRISEGARSDHATLKTMQDIIAGAISQGLIEAYREAQNLKQLDPDMVMAEAEKYFGTEGAWRDLLTDAFWGFEVKSQNDEIDHAPSHWSEAGR